MRLRRIITTLEEASGTISSGSQSAIEMPYMYLLFFVCSAPCPLLGNYPSLCFEHMTPTEIVSHEPFFVFVFFHKSLKKKIMMILTPHLIRASMTSSGFPGIFVCEAEDSSLYPLRFVRAEASQVFSHRRWSGSEEKRPINKGPVIFRPAELWTFLNLIRFGFWSTQVLIFSFTSPAKVGTVLAFLTSTQLEWTAHYILIM